MGDQPLGDRLGSLHFSLVDVLPQEMSRLACSPTSSVVKTAL
jgi:hypothetical protein